jgi:hypothetical protein
VAVEVPADVRREPVQKDRVLGHRPGHDLDQRGGGEPLPQRGEVLGDRVLEFQRGHRTEVVAAGVDDHDVRVQARVQLVEAVDQRLMPGPRRWPSLTNPVPS